MTQTVEALVVVAVGLLPGAVLLWTLETIVGSWWLKLTDRLYRFVGWSVIVHALLAPLTYGLWSFAGTIDPLGASAWRLLVVWAALLAYIAVPLFLGAVLGNAWKQGRSWSRRILGEPAPSAWDHLWSQVDVAWVRVRLRDGGWIAGRYSVAQGGPSAYASGFPNEADLYLAETVEVDENNGDWQLDAEGSPKERGAGVLLRWTDIAVLEVTPQ